MLVLISFSIILFIERRINNIEIEYKQNMSYAEIIAVNPANGVPTLTITVAAQAVGTAIEFNYVVYRAAN